jgi:TPR repeat protein
MQEDKAAVQIFSVIDPASPWKLPSSYSGFPKYSWKLSPAEWKNLLEKAKTGDPEAEWTVANGYDEGRKDRRGRILVRISSRKAAEWYRRSAEHGFVIAQCTLGVILGGNYGVKKDVQEALFWLKKAFRGGDSCAANNIAVTYRENGHLRQAVRWFRKAAAAGDESVLIQLGIHSYWGKSARKDHATAARCFRKAIRSNNVSELDRDDANFYLAIPYLEGKGVGKSQRTAKKYLERANRDNDHLAAQRLLEQMERLS